METIIGLRSQGGAPVTRRSGLIKKMHRYPVSPIGISLLGFFGLLKVSKITIFNYDLSKVSKMTFFNYDLSKVRQMTIFNYDLSKVIQMTILIMACSK